MVAVALNTVAYEKVVEKQGEIYKKYKERVDLIRIASAAIVVGIKGVEEELGLKRPKTEVQNKLVDYQQ